MKEFKHKRMDKRFSNGKVYIIGIRRPGTRIPKKKKGETFKVLGVKRENFRYYLKELEFRYNNRENLDEKVYLCLGGIKMSNHQIYTIGG